ncbi:hypothetical protein ACJIZ3_001316 [Penstemon smallii]|uniref:RING-type E3 ubiquitin transferase n=1 Tax=Penstemon smallii TaxID=265156 RepID=A0ABD3U5Z6_9LAMI
MQRDRSLNPFPETIDLNQGSFPNNTSMDHSESWDNNIANPVENRLLNYMLESGDENVSCTNAAQTSFNAWDHGEASSNANNLQERAFTNDSKIRLGSSSSSRPEDWPFEPSNISNRATERSLNMHNYSSNHDSLNLNSNQQIENHRRIPHSQMEPVPTFYNTSSKNIGNSSGSTSSTYLETNESSGGPPLGNWGSSCKRKALEGTSGQFYPSGSSNSLHPASATRNLTISPSSNHLEHQNSRGGLGLSRGAVTSSFPSSNIPEGSARNFNIRSNLGYHDSVRHHPVVYPAQQMLNADSSDLRPAMTLPMNQNNTLNQPHFMHVNESRGMHSYPWNGSLRSRGGSSSSSYMVSGERSLEEVNVRNSLRNNLEYPMIVSAPETRNVRPEQVDWSYAPGTSSRNNSSGSWAGPSSSGRSSSWLTHQNQTSQNHHMLTEAAPWITFPRNESDFGIRRDHFPVVHSREEVGSTSRTQHQPDQRSGSLVMDMAGDDVNSWRALAAYEGRHRVIRQVLSAMRRGVHLQAEDYVLIDPFINGFAELHDRHRDLRLDVDSMSYEELLALEERIGDVNTGLSEENIKVSMNRRNYAAKIDVSAKLEPCCICQEDYIIGDDMGILDCGHEFHTSCIKQWLILKNLCPICKTTALKP